MRPRIALWTIIAWTLLGGIALATTPIDPADPGILYTGRWSADNPSEPWSYWMGSSIAARFEGTSLIATMNAGWWGSPDYLRVIIDGDVAGSTKIAVGTSTGSVLLAWGLPDTTHSVEIIKETDVGYWTFLGFGLDDGSGLAAPPARPSRRIEFYGDSNLAGWSLEHEENASGDHLRGSYRGYAGIVSRMFDAEYQNVSRGGARISDIHGVFDRVDYWSATPIWDFADSPPDVVVVGLGANDVGRPKFAIKSDYHAFLDALRATHPDAHIVLYNGWGWDYDEPANYTHEVIAERVDPNLSYAVFPWLFEQWHGCEYDHAGMAQILADHLSAVLGWVPGPRDVMNGFGMNGDLANGGFEEQAPFGGYGWRYSTHSGTSRVSDPAGAAEGEHYLRLSGGGSSHQPIPASGGDTFDLTVWMRGGTAGDEANITMDFRDQEMWTSPLQTATEAFSLTTDWQEYTMTATAPSAGANPVYHMRVTFAAGAASTVDIDDAGMATATGVAALGPVSGRAGLSASPSPFGESTEIRFSLSEAGPVMLAVFDVRGRRVRHLIRDGEYEAGVHRMRWDGRDHAGHLLPAGVYFARLKSAAQEETRKLLLVY